MSKKKPIEKKEAVETVEILAVENLKSNQVHINGVGVVDIKPTKLKYFVVEKSANKDRTAMAHYDGANLIVQMGVSDVLHYTDGVEIVINLIKAILDIEKVDFFDNVTTKNINDMVRIANEINEIKSEDFIQENLEKEIEQEMKNTQINENQ